VILSRDIADMKE